MSPPTKPRSLDALAEEIRGLSIGAKLGLARELHGHGKRTLAIKVVRMALDEMRLELALRGEP